MQAEKRPNAAIVAIAALGRLPLLKSVPLSKQHFCDVIYDAIMTV